MFDIDYRLLIIVAWMILTTIYSIFQDRKTEQLEKIVRQQIDDEKHLLDILHTQGEVIDTIMQDLYDNDDVKEETEWES